MTGSDLMKYIKLCLTVVTGNYRFESTHNVQWRISKTSQMKCKIIAFIMYVFVRIDSEVAENIDGKNKLELLYLYIIKITHFREP